jgi:predicted  nucleic acid-binding Zn-ribbon protein
MDTERIAKLEAQVEGIKEDVADLKSDVKEVHSRITTGNREIMDKIETMQERLDQKMNSSAEAAKQQHEQIQLEIRSDINKVTDRVDVLERWRWMIVGGAIVVGYLIGHLEFFSKFFK